MYISLYTSQCLPLMHEEQRTKQTQTDSHPTCALSDVAPMALQLFSDLMGPGRGIEE